MESHPQRPRAGSARGRRPGRLVGLFTTLAVSALWAGAPTRAPSQCDPVQVLRDPVNRQGAYFGFTVDMSGDRIVIGSPALSMVEPVVHLYDSSTGSLLKTIHGAAGRYEGEGYQFGTAVALIGNNVIASQLFSRPGAPDGGGPSRGEVHLFDGATGEVLRTFTPGPEASAAFGTKLAAHEDLLLVGAPGYFDYFLYANFIGHAYLFNISTGALLRSFSQPESDTEDGLDFGLGVALSDKYIAIGDICAGGSGSVYVYDANSGAPIQTLRNPGSNNPNCGSWQVEFFGVAIAISGDLILVGSRDEGPGGDPGIAYLFHAQTGALIQTFNNPHPVGATYPLGVSVAISGDHALVGNVGAVYMFSLQTGLPIRAFPAPAHSDYFGLGLAVEGTRIALGRVDGMENIGEVLIYDCAPHPILDYLLGRAGDPAGLDLNGDTAVDIGDLFLR